MEKKVIWIVNEYNGPWDIRTRQTILSQHLEEHGYVVYLISGSRSNKGDKCAIEGKEFFRFIESDGAKYIVINTPPYKRNYERVFVSLLFQHRVWKFRKSLPKPDVIVSDFAGLFGNVFLRWKRKYGTKVIYDVLDLWPEGFIEMGYVKRSSVLAKCLYAMEHRSYRESDGIIFSMKGGRDYIIDKGWSKDFGGDVDTDNIGYLNNGVDLDSLEIQRKQYVLDDSDLDSGHFNVVYLGSISAMNGIDVLVETARVLKERDCNDIRILIYGYGNQEKLLRKMASEYGLGNIVFKGPLDKRYAINLLSRSDLNIFTFRDSPLWKYGVSPNKLTMYFASGKPVLSMIKPNYDLVEEKHAGLSVDNNPSVIADAIEEFYSMDKATYEQFGINARKAAVELDYKNLVKVLIEKIEEKE